MEHASSKKETSWLQALGVGLVGSLVVGLIALAFLWPSKVAEPRGYPVAITGSSSQQVAAMKKAIEQNTGDVITLVDVTDREEAVRKIEHREVYGALVLSMPQPEVLTASANGQAANGIMTTMSTTLQEKLRMLSSRSLPAGASAPQITVKVTDIVALHTQKFDIAQLTLPLALGGIVGGAALSRLVRGRWQRLGALVVYSLLAGGVLYLIIQTWFDLLPAQFWAITGAFSLGIFATASVIAGAFTQFGMRGLAAAGALVMLFANPLSGMTIPPFFLPEPWGAIGQGLTIGAAGTLLRSASYFPAASIWVPITVLCVWSLIGALGVVLQKQKQ